TAALQRAVVSRSTGRSVRSFQSQSKTERIGRAEIARQIFAQHAELVPAQAHARANNRLPGTIRACICTCDADRQRKCPTPYPRDANPVLERDQILAATHTVSTTDFDIGGHCDAGL